MKNVIKGTVVSSVERSIKNQDGSESKFYEIMADFGDGAVVLSSGKTVSLGEHEFTISPRSMYDRKSKITVLETPAVF